MGELSGRVSRARVEEGICVALVYVAYVEYFANSSCSIVGGLSAKARAQ